MRVLIFPFEHAEALAPLRSLCPDFLLPLAGKPLVEHLIEQLVMADIRTVTLLCDDRPDKVARYFGNGERWGCTLTLATVREPVALQRMVRAVLHNDDGMVLCLPANLPPSKELANFLATAVVTETGSGMMAAVAGPLFLTDGAMLRTLAQEADVASVAEMVALARRRGVLPAEETGGAALSLVTTTEALLSVQRDVLAGGVAGVRIPASPAGEGIWIGDHTEMAPGIRLEAPVFIGSNCRITGNGQIGPNASIAPFCLINNSDLICESLVMSGTATGPHTELNSIAARGATLVNLRTGAVVTVPDPFILGTIEAGTDRTKGGVVDLLTAALLWLLLLPMALPLLLLSMVLPGISRSEWLPGNRRLKTLTGDNPSLPFYLKEFRFGSLLLRRWPGLSAILTGHLVLVGAQVRAVPEAISEANESNFGLDAPCGLFQIWEVEGDPPESAEERQAREYFYEMTRTCRADLTVLLKAAMTFPQEE